MDLMPYGWLTNPPGHIRGVDRCSVDEKNSCSRSLVIYSKIVVFHVLTSPLANPLQWSLIQSADMVEAMLGPILEEEKQHNIGTVTTLHVLVRGKSDT